METYENIPSIVENYVAKFEYIDPELMEEIPDFKEEKKYYLQMITSMVKSSEKLEFDLTDKEKKQNYQLIFQNDKDFG